MMPKVVYGKHTCKGIPRPIHVPISCASITDHTAKGTSSHETGETGTSGSTKIEILSGKHNYL